MSSFPLYSRHLDLHTRHSLKLAMATSHLTLVSLIHSLLRTIYVANTKPKASTLIADIMKGTEVANPQRSSACDCTCVLTRVDHCLVNNRSCHACQMCLVLFLPVQSLLTCFRRHYTACSKSRDHTLRLRTCYGEVYGNIVSSPDQIFRARPADSSKNRAN